ncbi:SseB family protein [Cutibacterium sp. WCA-380-WT-3A]|uniref:SseB family protein n=1 Tax=Cutibacterium porci TaxID=2605781 RepID=A0A7K0J8Z8_9ACTN|nr:SseB family protein [Cutibacterium porci]MSS46415.1 SseB family protein [Cutibacterium porci]
MGDADPQVRGALAACLTDDAYRTSYLEAVSTLCAGARLFMPVLADEDGDMGAVKLTNEHGSTALLAFTGIDSLMAWDSRARPVPGSLSDLAATVTEVGADALLIDVAGPAPFVIGADVLTPIEKGARLVKLDDGWGWMRSAGSS